MIQKKYIDQFKTITTKRRDQVKNLKTRIPGFWKTALLNHSIIRASIEKWDEPVLEYLLDIETHYLNPDDLKSFSLDFHFAEDNPYFRNTLLTKKFLLQHDIDTGEWLLTQAVGSEIFWNDGKNIMSTYGTKKQRSRVNRDMRTVIVKKTRASFFNFFRTRTFPTEQDLQFLCEEEIHRLENFFSVEFEIGQILRDRIIPQALGWFLEIEYDSEEDNEEF